MELKLDIFTQILIHFERIEIMRDLRMGVFDVLVGINLLREGLDIPECALSGNIRCR